MLFTYMYCVVRKRVRLRRAGQCVRNAYVYYHEGLQVQEPQVLRIKTHTFGMNKKPEMCSTRTLHVKKK